MPLLPDKVGWKFRYKKVAKPDEVFPESGERNEVR